MTPPKPEDLMYTAQQIGRAVIDWARFEGFSGESCGSCRATANVLAGGPGWFCPCGHYNVQSWNHHQMSHEFPKYGPTRETIIAGHKSVLYAYYSADADAAYGHAVYKIKGKEVPVTIVCERQDQGKGWPDAVLVGQVTTGDCVKGNSRSSGFFKEKIDWNSKFYDILNMKPYFPKALLDDLIIKTPIYDKPLSITPPRLPQPTRITVVGDHKIPAAGYELPDNRLVATSTWTDSAGVKFVRIKISAGFRRKFGPDAIPVYDEPGVEARWPAKPAPKYRYRWVGDRYRKELIPE